MKKKSFALFFALVLIFVFAMPLSANESISEFAGGSGTKDDPYLIADKYQLNNVRHHLKSHFKLTDDIVFTKQDFSYNGDFYNAGTGWAPIGSSDWYAFSGVFDGNGHIISGLYVNKIESKDYTYVGLFGYNKGTIQNLGLVNSSISIKTKSSIHCFFYDTYAGGIVGCNDGEVNRCYNTGNVDATTIKSDTSGDAEICVGGIVGYNYDDGIISECYNTGNISGFSFDDVYTGGIVSYNEGTVNYSYNSGNVSSLSSTKLKATGDCSYAGGIVSYNEGSIHGSYNIGNIFASSSSTYSYPNFTDDVCGGGIVGYLYSGEISECYNAGCVRTVNRFSNYNIHYGGIAGYKERGVLSECYYLDFEVGGVGNTSSTCVKLSKEEMQNASVFDGFDFDSVWSISSEADYKFPTLKTLNHVEKVENTTDFVGGNGSVWNPYLIKTKEQLHNVKSDVNAFYQLDADIKFDESDFTKGSIYYNDGSGWDPIGADYAESFTGVFDGNGHTISGLYVNIVRTDNLVAGLFGYNKGIIENLGVVDSTVSAQILLSSISAESAFAGGIAGNNRGVIRRCYNTGNVSADDFVGGITGYNYFGTISECFNTGRIRIFLNSESNNSDAGGIAGYNFEGDIIDCYNIGIANAQSAGGITGYNDFGILKSCYYLDNISVGAGGSFDAGVKCSEGQMKSAATFSGFDFDNTWTFNTSLGYPYPQLKILPVVNVDLLSTSNPTVTFADVSLDAYYATSVAWAVDKGITTGTSVTTFSPDNSCTRAQAVTFLWRAAGKPDSRSSYNPFRDVKKGEYYYDAVLWAVGQGITNGTSDTTFSPDATCNRAQIVTFLYRAEGEPNVAVRNTFSDVKNNAYYAKAVAWAVANGVTTGTSANTFSPDSDCTRGQIVTFLYRAEN